MPASGVEQTPIQTGSCIPGLPLQAAAGPGALRGWTLLLSNPREMDTGEASVSWAQMGQANKGLSHGTEHHRPGAFPALLARPQARQLSSPRAPPSPHRARQGSSHFIFTSSHFQQTNQGANRIYFTLIY